MNKIKIYIILLLCAISVTGIKAQASYDSRVQYDGSVKVVCNALEERDNMLFVEMNIEVDNLALNKTQSWTVIPELTDGTRSTLMPSVVIQGNNKKHMRTRKANLSIRDGSNALQPYRVINVKGKTTRGRVLYSVEIPYLPWMDDAKLLLRQELRSSAERTQLFMSELPGAVRLQAREPYLVQPVVAFMVPEKEEVKSRKIQAQAFLDFQSGRSNIVTTFRRNPEELRKIKELLDDVRANEHYEVMGLFIEGYASPEGSYAINQKLAAERAEALKQHIGSNFGVSTDIIGITSMAEDWGGLRVLVEDSNLPNKSAILGVIDSEDAPDVKERNIKRYPNDYRTMLNEMFPQLRRSDYQVNFKVKSFSLDESRDIFDKDPTMLSLFELYTLAKTYQIGSSEFNNIYDIIGRLYPDNEAARINIAASLFHNGEYQGAKRRLEGIETPHAYNILGAIALAEGDLDTAERHLLTARAGGSRAAEHNLTELQKKRDDEVKMARYRNR